eukprot:TRINITY_DN2930_c0_g1_i2.p1 TRINITY_DN2930_c0_g1~~TRINITY_DN2930_c0_g1_i2.p1  ORF type:complete len:134 (-),score=21.48 TRINITY_DN2930_c0_g1_i2:371-772(-)
MTRDSLNSAFAAGIIAEQVIGYLLKHAHPHVAHRKPVLPETVSDQIRLWEHDRNRVTSTPAVLYEDFQSEEMFAAMVAYARDSGGLLWQNPKQMRMVGRAELHEQMKTFLKRKGAGGARGGVGASTVAAQKRQ